jgi:hypothetical protein
MKFNFIFSILFSVFLLVSCSRNYINPWFFGTEQIKNDVFNTLESHLLFKVDRSNFNSDVIFNEEKVIKYNEGLIIINYESSDNQGSYINVMIKKAYFKTTKKLSKVIRKHLKNDLNEKGDNIISELKGFKWEVL